VIFTGWPLSCRWLGAVEVLACPHCDRLFQVTSAVRGKTIRCRDCRGIFHIPHDTSSVPLSDLGSARATDKSLPPLANPCVIDGHDARSCPQCGRTFRMKAAFADKSIRCRGCKMTFRVAPTEPSTEPTPASTRPDRVNPPLIPPTPGSPPTIFEDVGDPIDVASPGPPPRSVVRPRNMPSLSPHKESAVPQLIAVVFGGMCALPLTQLLLWFVFQKDPLGVASLLPAALRALLPDHLGQ